MFAHTAEPVGSIFGVRLLAVHDAVPEAAVRSLQSLGERVAFVEAGEVQVQSAQRGLGSTRFEEEASGGESFQMFFGFNRGRPRGSQRHGAQPVFTHGEDFKNGRPIVCSKKIH